MKSFQVIGLINEFHSANPDAPEDCAEPFNAWLIATHGDAVAAEVAEFLETKIL